MVPGLY